jgi:hypothetical protein
MLKIGSRVKYSRLTVEDFKEANGSYREPFEGVVVAVVDGSTVAVGWDGRRAVPEHVARLVEVSYV